MAALGATPVYFTLGNWDDYAGSFGLLPDDPFLADTATLFFDEFLLGTANRQAFEATYRAGGHYAADVPGTGLVVLGVNSGFLAPQSTAGADAIGFVFYPPSPRYVTPERAAELARRIPPFVDVVGLFVNADPAAVLATCASVPLNLLQFHGDEDAAYCRQFSRPYLRAARVRPGLDLVEFARSFPDARGLLLERVTGKRLDILIKEMILAPLDSRDLSGI